MGGYLRVMGVGNLQEVEEERVGGRISRGSELARRGQIFATLRNI